MESLSFGSQGKSAEHIFPGLYDLKNLKYKLVSLDKTGVVMIYTSQMEQWKWKK